MRDLGLRESTLAGGEGVLKDPRPDLLEYQRKPRKISNGKVDKRDGGLKPATLVYQFESRKLEVSTIKLHNVKQLFSIMLSLKFVYIFTA